MAHSACLVHRHPGSGAHNRYQLLPFHSGDRPDLITFMHCQTEDKSILLNFRHLGKRPCTVFKLAGRKKILLYVHLIYKHID